MLLKVKSYFKNPNPLIMEMHFLVFKTLTKSFMMFSQLRCSLKSKLMKIGNLAFISLPATKQTTNKRRNLTKPRP